MITHILDNNAVIALIGRRSQKLADRIFAAKPGALALPSIVAYELYFGAHKSTKIEHNLETLRLLFSDVPILDFDRNDAFVAGQIRADLTGKGTPIGPYDILIAGQAKARDLVVITNNVGEFARVDGLRVEDWTL